MKQYFDLDAEKIDPTLLRSMHDLMIYMCFMYIMSYNSVLPCSVVNLILLVLVVIC